MTELNEGHWAILSPCLLSMHILDKLHPFHITASVCPWGSFCPWSWRGSSPLLPPSWIVF